MPIYALDYATPAIDPQAYVHPDAVQSYLDLAERHRTGLRRID